MRPDYAGRLTDSQTPPRQDLTPWRGGPIVFYMDTTSKTIRTLNPVTDNGRLARVDGHEGRLLYADNPSYPKAMKVTHWFLIEPSPIPQFETQARSLQWGTDVAVEFIQVG